MFLSGAKQSLDRILSRVQKVWKCATVRLKCVCSAQYSIGRNLSSVCLDYFVSNKGW